MNAPKNKPTFLTTPRFSELSIETGKVYTIRYYPDGRNDYLVNFALVPNFPKTPATKALLDMAARVDRKIMQLPLLPFDGSEYRQLWYEIKREVEG
jgi:hypothetical protein